VIAAGPMAVAVFQAIRQLAGPLMSNLNQMGQLACLFKTDKV